MGDAEKGLVCVLDLGTTSIKAALVDESGRFSASRACPAPPLDAGAGTFDALEYCRLVFDLIRGTLQDASGSVAAVSLSSQRATILALGSDGVPLAPACSWLSSRCAPAATRFYESLGDGRFRALTGLLPSPIYSIAKLAGGELPQGPPVASYADLQSFVLRQLGADALFIDPSNASALGLCELARPAWSRELCAALELSEAVLPRITAAGSVVGGVSDRTSDATGLASGTPLVLGGGDQQCAVLGAGAFDSGRLALSLGTSAALSGPVMQVPAPPPEGLIAGHHVVPGQWVVEGFIPTFGAAADWAAQALGLGDVDALSLCAGEVDDSGGLTFLPSLAGTGSPDFDGISRGAWLGLSTDTRPPQMARAVFEGLASELERVASCFFPVAPLAGVRAVGGGSRGALLLQLIADTLAVDLTVCAHGDAALLGAAALAWSGVGRYPDACTAADAIGAGAGVVLSPIEDPGRVERLARHAVGVSSARSLARAGDLGMTWRAGDWPDVRELTAIRAAAISFAGVGLYRYLVDGTVIFLDQGAFDLLDLSERFPDPGAVIGMNISDLFEHVLPSGELRKVVTQRGEVRRFEYPYRTLTGQDRWVYHHAYRVQDPASGLDAVQVISQDITPLKLSARALAASERQYRNLAEQSLQGLLVFQGQPPSLRFTNGAVSELTGWVRDSLSCVFAEDLTDLFHPDERGWWREQIQRLTEGDLKVERRDLRLLEGGEINRWLTVLSGPIEYEGGYALQLVLVDDTERHRSQERHRQVEERMQQAQKLESLGVLAGGIAHDFNNLLATILGNTELAANSLPEDSVALEKLQRVGAAASRATDLCQQLLAYSGRGQFSMEALDLRTLILDTAELLKVSIAASVRLTYAFEDELPPIVGDAAQLRQVLMNLLTNASEAVEERRRSDGPIEGQSVIRFTARRCELDQARLDELAPGDELSPGPFVLVEVEDEGAGMSPLVVGQIFEPFYTTKFAGRGLGLAAVKGIMSGHGGLVCVHSKPGRGTCFSCYFPATKASAGVASRAPVADLGEVPEALGERRGRGLALVVDDEPAVRAMAADLLQLLGFETLEVDGGAPAVEILREAEVLPSLVLLDLTMPGLSGHETFKLLRALEPDVPILLSSGYDRQSLPIDLRVERAAGFLKKPYGLHELEASVSQLISGIQRGTR